MIGGNTCEFYTLIFLPQRIRETECRREIFVSFVSPLEMYYNK